MDIKDLVDFGSSFRKLDPDQILYYLKYNPVTGTMVQARQRLDMTGLTGEDESTLFLVIERQPEFKLDAFRGLINQMNEGPAKMTLDEVQETWIIFDYAFTAGEHHTRPIIDN